MSSSDEAHSSDRFLRLLALAAIRDLKLRDQVALLFKAGFRATEIADLLGTSQNSVSVRLNELRRSNLLPKLAKKRLQ